MFTYCWALEGIALANFSALPAYLRLWRLLSKVSWSVRSDLLQTYRRTTVHVKMPPTFGNICK